MAFKDRVKHDIHRVFMNMNHYGETHYWNGMEIVCVPDDEEALKRKNNNVNDISWDNNIRDVLIHTPLEGFPGGREPEPNTHIVFDTRPMKVLDVKHNIGMLDILLTALDPREVMG